MPQFATAAGMRRGFLFTTKASAAETASTTHSSFDTGPESGAVVVTVDVTAASGTTPTMTVVVEGSDDGSTWFELGTVGLNGYRSGSVGTAPTNFTAAATQRGVFPATQFIRTRSVIAGTTPSFTYSVNAQAC